MKMRAFTLNDGERDFLRRDRTVAGFAVFGRQTFQSLGGFGLVAVIDMFWRFESVANSLQFGRLFFPCGFNLDQSVGV